MNTENNNKLDLVEIARNYFIAAKENVAEVNKITGNFYSYFFAISTFFLGFSVTFDNILGGLNKYGLLFLIISVISGLISIIIAILNIISNRQDINSRAEVFYQLQRNCYNYIKKNQRFVDEVPDELKFELVYKKEPIKFTKFAIYAFFIQIVFGVLVLFTKISFDIVLK